MKRILLLMFVILITAPDVRSEGSNGSDKQAFVR
jgi:hypothetical protein